MIIKRQKLYAVRRFKLKPIIDRTGLFHHYTTPNAIPGINKRGLTYRVGKKTGISAIEGATDNLLGKNINLLNEEGLKTTTKLGGLVDKKGNIINSEYTLDTLRNVLTKNPEFVKTLPEHHLVGGIDRSRLFYPAGFKGTVGDPNNPSHTLHTIDGLRWQWDTKGGKAPFTQIVHRKTRNPVRIVIKGQAPVGRGSDVREVILRPDSGSILSKDLLYELPESGVLRRDPDIKRLKRYLKGHKGKVNATRETMEALYGKQWPYLDQFPREI